VKTKLLASALTLFVFTAMAAERPSGLSPQQVEGLMNGRGMGLSMPAEMNGKPGPLHVLELADALELTETQRQAAGDLVARMKAAAIPLGREVVAKEASLDAVFAASLADPAKAQALVADIAALQGRLRWVHLETHLAMTAVLTPGQAERYGHLRHQSGH
jgi:Spy/CpxP family protein refolding chaperone